MTWFWSPSVPKPPDVKSLTPLLTVSKTISRIAESFLYEWVVLSIDEESEMRRHQLLSSLATRPHTLDLVKYLVIDKPYTYCRDELRVSTFNAVRPLFPALKGLRGISIHNMLVPPYVTTDLHLFQELGVFELLESILEDVDGAPAAIGDGLPSIRHVVLRGYDWEDLNESQTRLITLLIGTSLETLQIGPDYIHAFLASLAPSSTITLNQLQTLYTDILIGSSSYSELFEMLQLCPSITTLKVWKSPFDDSGTKVDPPVVDVVRHLQTLEAPSDLASLLAPGRPIRSLSLRNHGSLNGPGLDWLTQSTTPLTCLCLQVMAESMLMDISRIFPTLEELSFNLYGVVRILSYTLGSQATDARIRIDLRPMVGGAIGSSQKPPDSHLSSWHPA